jgi:hypothetical protein
MNIKLTISLIFGLLIHSLTTIAQYQGAVSVSAQEKDIKSNSKFEIGFHYGPAWTSGQTKDFATKGNTFSMDLGSNNGLIYFGTEISITHWKDYNKLPEAKDLNFNETNFLWLVQTKLFMGEGKVQPYIGCGTDLISFGESILTVDEEEDDYYSNYDEEHRNYNAWIVPNFGIRWKMGKDLNGNVGFSADLSGNYSYTRLQIGLVF